eukprot:9040619-Alexandrium_andersonii.AAC.1
MRTASGKPRTVVRPWTSWPHRSGREARWRRAARSPRTITTPVQPWVSTRRPATSLAATRK